MSDARAQAALERATAAKKDSEEALVQAQRLAQEVKPVMKDLAAQRRANHIAFDLYLAMLHGSKQ
jgi:ferric-dicitrate binding protein FerR (iron transport regulator)